MEYTTAIIWIGGWIVAATITTIAGLIYKEFHKTKPVEIKRDLNTIHNVYLMKKNHVDSIKKKPMHPYRKRFEKTQNSK